MPLILKHQTVEQFVARVRAAYRDSDKDRLIQIARFIIGGIQAGNFTDAQVRSAFGLNVTQWNNLKTKMQNYIAAHNTVQSAVGE